MRLQMPSHASRCWLTASALACCSITGEAQEGLLGTGGIRGLIQDTQGKAIIGAQITISGSRLIVESDDSGRFELAKVRPGMLTLRFRRLGFEPDTVQLVVLAGKTLPLEIKLSRLDVSLTPVVITGRSNLTGWREGFYHRRNAGSGHYFTAADIEKRNPRLLTDMFRALPGVTVRPSRGIIRNQLRFRNKTCPPIVWLDGAPLASGEFDVDGITPFSVAGVEVYTGSIVPPNFVTPLHTNSCGAIVIWSKDPPPRARRQDPRVASAAAEIAKLVENRQIFTAAQVDVTARQDSLRPVRPGYPDDLYDAQVGGSVMVEFIVTASGEVDPDRISVVFATHPGFVEPVRLALETAKYIPALRGNYPVHQYVQHEFHFVPDTTRRRR